MILNSHWWRVSGGISRERKGGGLSKQKREGVLVWPAERGKTRKGWSGEPGSSRVRMTGRVRCTGEGVRVRVCG
jgi:hypothetical protein